MTDNIPNIPRKLDGESYIKTVAMLSRAFPGGFIYPSTGEYIIHKRANSYFCLQTCESELDVKCKVLEWLSRDAYKTQPYRTNISNNKFHDFIRNGINTFLGTKFSEEDIELVYTYLGNCCDHDRTVQFIESGYDMQMLRELHREKCKKYHYDEEREDL